MKRLLLLLLLLALPLLAQEEEPEYVPVGRDQLVDSRLVFELGSLASPPDVKWRVEVAGDTVHYEGVVRDASLAAREVYYDVYVTNSMEGYTSDEARGLFEAMLNEGATIGPVSSAQRPFKGSYRCTFEFHKSRGWMALGSSPDHALLVTGQGMTSAEYDAFLASFRPSQEYRPFEHVKTEREPLPLVAGRLEIERGSIASPPDTTWYLGASEGLKSYVGIRTRESGQERFSVAFFDRRLNSESQAQVFLDGYAESSGFEARRRRVQKLEREIRIDFEAFSADTSVPGAILLREESGNTFCFSAIGPVDELQALADSLRPDPKLVEDERGQLQMIGIIAALIAFFINVCVAGTTLIVSLLTPRRVVTLIGMGLLGLVALLEGGSLVLMLALRNSEPYQVGYATGFIGTLLALTTVLPLVALLVRHRYLPA